MPLHWQDAAWSFVPALFLRFCKGIWGGQDLACIAGEFLGTGLGRAIKAGKTSSCNSPFGLDAAGEIFLISRTFWSFFVCCISTKLIILRSPTQYMNRDSCCSRSLDPSLISSRLLRDWHLFSSTIHFKSTVSNPLCGVPKNRNPYVDLARSLVS